MSMSMPEVFVPEVFVPEVFVPEVFVIGGGPVGLAAAIAAAQAGFTVELAEPCAGPVDKCCGEGLLPPAIAALAQLGIPRKLLEQHAEPACGIRFFGSGQEAGARFPAAPALGMRRTALHTLLEERAAALGVRHTRAAARLERGTVLINGERREPKWIIGADGAQSAVRRAAGLDGGRTASRRFALRQHFQLAPGTQKSRYVDVYWAAGTQAYVTPVAEGCIGVAVLSMKKLTSMPDALLLFPALLRLLKGAVPASTPRGAVSTHRTLRWVHHGTVALVGDASGGVDAITGDGLALGFLQALALGRALQTGSLKQYGHEHARLSRTARLMSRTLLAMGSHPGLTQLSIFLLGRLPGLFPALLYFHMQLPIIRNELNELLEEASPWQACLPVLISIPSAKLIPMSRRTPPAAKSA